MKTELKSSLLDKIKKKDLSSFSCFDFTEFASYKTISKSLERMEDDGDLFRVFPGVYCLYKYDEVLKTQVLPSVDSIVNTIARKNRWVVCPTGVASLNIMGLSTQVVATHTYLSNGPYKSYLILDNEVKLKRTMNRELVGCSYKTNLLIQCIKTIGEDIDSNQIEALSNKLSSSEKENAIKETLMVQTWIREVIIKVCGVQK